MIEVVLVYALINIIFELTVLSLFVPARARLVLLGNPRLKKAIHLVMLIGTLYIHWGSVTGTMAGFIAFPASILAMALAKQVFGFIEGDVYHRRLIGYTAEELKERTA